MIWRRHGLPAGFVLLALIAALIGWPGRAAAQVGSDRYASIIIDAGTGQVLSQANADAPRRPASLTKLMTLYLTFEALRDHRITLDTLVPVSEHAAMMEPSKLGLLPGMRLTVQQAILSLVTKSANDSAAALGELLGGDEPRFAAMMTLRARALGMTNTTFRNASGLPDPDQWTTARDLATLARHILTDYPNEYGYFDTPSFIYRGQVIYNHDRMLRSYPGADGMKTGYTELSGHNLITSAVRGGVRLIGVVLGAETNPERDAHMAALLDAAYIRMDVPIDRPREFPRTRLASRFSLIPQAQASTLATVRPWEPRAHPVASRWNTRPPPAWSVQAGAFPSRLAAITAANAARALGHGGEAHVEAVRHGRRVIWRAQVAGLSAADAQGVCSDLGRHRKACEVIRPTPGRLARS